MNKNLNTLIREMETEVREFFKSLQGKAITIDYVAGMQSIDFIHNCFITETESEIIFDDEDTERCAIVFNKDKTYIEVDSLLDQAYITLGNVEVMIYTA